MTNQTLTLAAAETALRKLPSMKHPEWITLQAALDALRGVAGDRDEALEAADAMEQAVWRFVRDETIASAKALRDALTTYRQKRGQDDE